MAKSVHRACGQSFSGLTAFDRHLRWHRRPPWVDCVAPESAGLVWSEARQAWATHIGVLASQDAGGRPPYLTDGNDAESANCKADTAT